MLISKLLLSCGTEFAHAIFKDRKETDTKELNFLLIRQLSQVNNAGNYIKVA